MKMFTAVLAFYLILASCGPGTGQPTPPVSPPTSYTDIDGQPPERLEGSHQPTPSVSDPWASIRIDDQVLERLRGRNQPLPVSGPMPYIYSIYHSLGFLGRLDYAPGTLKVWAPGDDTRLILNAQGRNRERGALTYLKTDHGNWAVLLSDDNILLSLLPVGGGRAYTARLRDGKPWFDLMVEDRPSISDGIISDGTHASDILVTPPGITALYDHHQQSPLLQTPSVSWLSSSLPAGTTIQMALGWGTKKIFFANGYVNVDRPEEYYRYARVKTLLVTSGRNTQEIILRDTPHYQAFTLPFTIPPGGKVVFTLKDFYPGKEPMAAINEILPVRLGRE